MYLRIHIAAALVLCLSITLGCSQKELPSEGTRYSGDSYIIENVPFVKQKDDFCGPAAMASVSAYYGNNLTQDEIAKKVYTPELKGVLISDIENFARDEGYSVKTENGNLANLKHLIKEDKPVILLVDRGTWKLSLPHYYVAYGYSNGGESFIIHSGDKEGVVIKSSKLDSEWEKMNRLMLVIEQ